MTDVIVRLTSFPACDVLVRESEIDAAIKASGTRTYKTRIDRAVRAIAIGKRVGTYPKQPGDLRPVVPEPAELPPVVALDNRRELVRI